MTLTCVLCMLVYFTNNVILLICNSALQLIRLCPLRRLLGVMLLLMLLNLATLVWSHGGLVWPPPWQDGDHLGVEEAYTFIMKHYPVQRDAKTGRVISNIWSWLTDQVYHQTRKYCIAQTKPNGHASLFTL